VILSPRKSVTRFFIPLIDVLILLFCIFLLMPFVSTPAKPDAADAKKAEDKTPPDVKKLEADLKEAKFLIQRLEKKLQAPITDRLAVKVLEIDPTNGTLFYYNPNRVDLKTEEAILRLIRQAKEDASKGGVVKDVFFLILYPRKPTGFPTGPQRQQIEQWFRDVPYGFDIPSSSP
jgi:hypothetical protein